MQRIHAEFGFEIGFVLLENSSVTLPYTRDEGMARNKAMATNFGTKIAITARTIVQAVV